MNGQDILVIVFLVAFILLGVVGYFVSKKNNTIDKENK